MPNSADANKVLKMLLNKEIAAVLAKVCIKDLGKNAEKCVFEATT